MRTIGLLGGMSWESTALYYRLLNEEVRDRLGGYTSARCVLLSVDFAPIQALQAAGDWTGAARVLAGDARAVQAAGADFLVLCTNTMHTIADEIAAAVDIPLLHIGDSTAEAVAGAGLTCVGLLGTAYTMEQPFLVERLRATGLDVLVPEKADRDLVHRVVYDELVLGVVREESRSAYRDVVERLVGRGAQGVVLGCTEIELLIAPGDLGVPAFPTTALHASAAVRAALADDRDDPSAWPRRGPASGGGPRGPSPTIGR